MVVLAYDDGVVAIAYIFSFRSISMMRAFMVVRPLRRPRAGPAQARAGSAQAPRIRNKSKHFESEQSLRSAASSSSRGRHADSSCAHARAIGSQQTSAARLQALHAAGTQTLCARMRACTSHRVPANLRSSASRLGLNHEPVTSHRAQGRRHGASVLASAWQYCTNTAALRSPEVEASGSALVQLAMQGLQGMTRRGGGPARCSLASLRNRLWICTL